MRNLFLGLVLTALTGATLAAKAEQPTDEWLGHGATLKNAKVACLNINSRACLPYLAESVATVNLLTKLTDLDTDATKKHSPTPWKLPTPHGHTLSCTDALLQQMNGISLLQATLSQESPDTFTWYWTDALYYVAINDFCKR